MMDFKEIVSKLEVGNSYTLFKHNDFGFPCSLKFKLHSFKLEPYAQYRETLVIYYVQKGKRKVQGTRLYGNVSFAIWKGLVDVNTEMFVEKRIGSSGMVIEESFLCFSPGYMDRALMSVSEEPLVLVEEKD